MFKGNNKTLEEGVKSVNVFIVNFGQENTGWYVNSYVFLLLKKDSEKIH